MFDDCFQVLSYRFRVRTSVPDAADALVRVLGSFRASVRAPRTLYEFRSEETGHGTRYQVVLDGEILKETLAPPAAFRYLIDHIFSTLIRATEGHLLIRAGAVTTRGKAIVMPGGPRVGKTSLAAALVERGFDFLSDEYACLDATDSTVAPLPKALLMRLEDSVGAANGAGPDGTEWLSGYRPIPVDDLRLGATGTSAPIGLVICPRREATQDGADIQRITRSEAIVELGRNAFNFKRFNGTGIAILVRAVSEALCYRLTYSDLQAAIEGIQQITAVTELVRLSGDSRNGAAAEVMAFPERFVTAPTWGRLQSPLIAAGARVERGDVIGHFRIDGLSIPLISHTNGRWLAWLAWEGERVPPGRILGRVSVE